MMEQPQQHPADMIHMFLLSLGKEQNVIEINKHKDIQHFSEDTIDQGRKNSGGVGESRWHHQVLIVDTRGVEDCFPLVPLTDPNVLRRLSLVKIWGP